MTVTVAALTADAVSAPAARVGRPVTVTGVLAAGDRPGCGWSAGSPARWQVLTRVDDRGGRVLRGARSPRRRPAFWRLRVGHVARAAAPLATAALPLLDVYRLHTYSVRDPWRGPCGRRRTFRADVAATYADPRGWLRGHHRFRPAAPGRPGDFTVVLAQARYLPAFSSVLLRRRTAAGSAAT